MNGLIELSIPARGEMLSCTLMGMAQGRIHLDADRPIGPETRVMLKFARVTFEAIVEYSTLKSGKYRVCASVTAEAEKRRREPRLPIHQHATITALAENAQNTMSIPCILTDLSRSGMRAQISEPLISGTMVCVETDTTLVAGEVRHCQRRPGYHEIGVEITDIITDAKQGEKEEGFVKNLRWKLAALIVGEELTFARRFLR
jgi:hypothetical protein